MKELKNSLWNDLFKGFAEVTQLFNAYKFHIEHLNGKTKEEEIEDFIHHQMSTLRSLCDSHLAKVQHNLIAIIVDWKSKKDEKKDEL